MNAEQRKARDLAKRALDDVTVVRVTLGKVPLGYRLLQKEGLLKTRRVPGEPDKVDVRWKEKP